MGGWEPPMGWEPEVPHKFQLHSYAVTPLRIWYRINKVTQSTLAVPGKK